MTSDMIQKVTLERIENEIVLLKESTNKMESMLHTIIEEIRKVQNKHDFTTGGD